MNKRGLREAEARALIHRLENEVRLCACGCGREVTQRQILATEACRQRASRRARRDSSMRVESGRVTQALPL